MVQASLDNLDILVFPESTEAVTHIVNDFLLNVGVQSCLPLLAIITLDDQVSMSRIKPSKLTVY